jgi:hypothetical protein
MGGSPRLSAEQLAARAGEKQMSHIQLYEQDDMNYGSDNFRRNSAVKAAKTNRPTHGRRRGKSPQSVNGIHRRRNRKMAW